MLLGSWLGGPLGGGPDSTPSRSSTIISSPSGVDFGVDVSTFPVVDTTFSQIRGFRVLAEALARRLLTRRGLLSFHRDYGRDIRDYINEAMDDTSLGRCKEEAANELRQDERVVDADVLATFSPSTGVLMLTCKVDTAQGPFSFVLALSKLDAQLYLGAA